MLEKLKERSLVDKCFVSSVCNASDELGERDLRDAATSKIPGTQGNSQGMLYVNIFINRDTYIPSPPTFRHDRSHCL